MSTSIVIPLGYGSRWNNLELRYCLRSVEKYLTSYGDVFIVGDKPDWLKNVVHIPCPDYGTQIYDKEHNIFCKIMAACADERVSDDFLFMNDDHYLLRGYNAGAFPYYYDSCLDHKLTVTEYKRTVENTAAIISPNALYADIHCPIVYNKNAFSSLSKYNWQIKYGYCIKTLYCYEHVLCGNMRAMTDLKIHSAMPLATIQDMIKGRSWFSIGDKAFDGDIRQVLQDLYPHKSKFE